MPTIDEEAWMSEVRAVLNAVCDAVWSAVHEKPRFQASGDPILPRFTFTSEAIARLEQSVPRGKAVGSAKLASAQVVREQWHRHRDLHPHLWSYQSWRAERVRASGTQNLDNSSFAEHMRARRGAPDPDKLFSQEMLAAMRNSPVLFAKNVLPDPPSFELKVVESAALPEGTVSLGFDAGYAPGGSVLAINIKHE